MRRVLTRRLDQLAHRRPAGCPLCRDWPLYWLVGDGDPDPPERCVQCGRTPHYSPMQLIGVRIADI